MPDFLVSAATGALGPVLNKLAALLSDEYKRFKGVRGEVKFLIRELEAMHAFLVKKSEEENPDVQDKVWMKEVRELSYDIEDSLDDFRVCVDDDSAKPDGFINKCKNLLAKTKARRRIAKAIQDLKLQVKEVSERNARYNQINNTFMNTSKVTVDPRALAIFEDASTLVGIDQPKQEIISFLKMDDGDISLQQPKIVSIVGIGGIGKTTLANRVYEELNGFECRVFLSVSRNPDIFGILRTIFIKVTGRVCNMTDIQQLIMEIKDFLRTKRYLVVVDDVWDVKTWETIKCALPNNSCGNVIITTTRIHDVARTCCSFCPDGWVYQPKPLEEHDSKTLFHNRIFGPGNECPEYLKEVSDKILKKCGGLPLAIVTISALLANKAQNGVHLVTEWDQVQTSIGRGLERDSTVEGMMRILSLSYFDLPSHLKACLLYLSTFPEDYEIKKDRLIRLWVAEGFIPAESTCTLYESGEKSFTKLINRNLILPKEIINRTGNVDSCCLHDTILDFIVCKSTEENFVTVHGIRRLTSPPGIKFRRLSLQGKTDGDVIIHSNQNYANVRSIISFGFPCSLLGVRFLRVLDFMGCRRLQNHHLADIGELLQLRYLSLRNTEITELPEQIGALQYLETLDIRECYIQLPTAIVRLKRLVNLLCPLMLNSLPSGIKNMQALEELNSVAIDIKETFVCVEEIGDLTKMRHLDISVSSSGIIDEESYVDLVKKMVSSLRRLNKLQTLDVQFDNCDDVGYDVIFKGDDIIVEVPWCSASLRNLVLKMNPMPRVPSWMKSLVNMEELWLSIKKLDQESLCILGDLPVLVVLALEIVNNDEGIHSTDKERLVVRNRHGYRSLSLFCVETGFPLDRRPSIPMLTFEAGSMSNLERFIVHFDADLTISVSNGHLDFGLKHLSQLKQVECDIHGTKLNIWLVQNAIKKALANHPKRPSFENNHFPSTEGERSSRVCLRPRRRSQSTVHTTQPKPPSIADDVVICTSGDDKTSSSTKDDNTSAGQSLTAALPLHTDLSFTINHHGASTETGRRHGRELIQGAPVITDLVKGTTEEQIVADDAIICTSGGNDNMRSSTMDDNTCQSLTAALALPTDLSFTIHHDGTSPDVGSRHRQQRRQLKAQQGATIRGRELIQCAPVFPDGIKGAPGAARETSAVLGPRLIAAPQLQGTLVPPCFTFSSGSLHNAEVVQQAMDCYKLSLRDDDLANALSSAFDGLCLGNDHPGPSASLDTGSSSCQGGGSEEEQQSDE